MHDASPEELVRACRRGDPTAWDEVLNRYGRLIWAVARRMGASQEEAEEIFQRTWVAVVRGIGQVKKPRLLASFIAGAARHQTQQLYDEARRRRRMASLDEQLDLGIEPAVEATGDTGLEDSERVALLYQALDRLDGRCRQLLELLFLADPPLDYQLIAARTGLAQGSIGPLRARCLGRLQRRFFDLYQQPSEDD